MQQLTDYQIAKDIVDALKKFKPTTITVQNVNNFRKYLKHDLTVKAGINKNFVTKVKPRGSLNVEIIRIA